MVEVLQSSKNGLVVLRWSGVLSEDEVVRLTREVEDRIREFGKVRVLIELAAFEGFSVKADWARVKWSLEHMANVECVAVVGPEDVANALAFVGVTTVDHPVEVFPPEERDKALAWLTSFSKGQG